MDFMLLLSMSYIWLYQVDISTKYDKSSLAVASLFIVLTIYIYRNCLGCEYGIYILLHRGAGLLLAGWLAGWLALIYFHRRLNNTTTQT